MYFPYSHIYASQHTSTKYIPFLTLTYFCAFYLQLQTFLHTTHSTWWTIRDEMRHRGNQTKNADKINTSWKEMHFHVSRIHSSVIITIIFHFLWCTNFFHHHHLITHNFCLCHTMKQIKYENCFIYLNLSHTHTHIHSGKLLTFWLLYVCMYRKIQVRC